MQDLFKPFNGNDDIGDGDRQYPMIMYTYNYTYYVGSINPHRFISYWKSRLLDKSINK
jgi:hypothetical protein